MSVNYCTQDTDFCFRGKTKTSAWIRQAALNEGWSVGELSVVFCSDAALLAVNNQYLHHNYFTDIITFDDSDRKKHRIAGDLMISIDTVRDNAGTFGTTFERELQRVIIHGVMHLCGYGDKTDGEAKQMRILEDKYLALFYNTPTQSHPAQGSPTQKRG